MVACSVSTLLDPVLIEDKVGTVLPTDSIEHEREQATAAVYQRVGPVVSHCERVRSLGKLS